MEILGLITARGGSKSIPGKNLYPIAGKPLLMYTIESAKHANSISRLIISTDDQEIAEVAKAGGVEVPFMRPEEFAEDLTPDLPVFEHALRWLEEGENYVPDAVVHLRPTAPLRASQDIDDCITLLLEHPEADSVRSVCEPIHSPFTMYSLLESDTFLRPLLKNVYPDFYAENPEAHNMPRQTLPKTWFHIGDTDVIRRETIIEKRSMTGEHILPFFQVHWRSVDIDSLREIDLAEELIIEHKKKTGKEIWQR